MTTYTTTCDTCGRTFTNRYEKQAARSLRNHSCAKQLAKIASAQRRIARDAAVDKTPKPCHHKRAHHEHGTHACYVLDRCRCHPCTAANTTYERQRGRLHAYGRFTHLVDADPVREHVAHLQAQGLGLKTIAARAGVSRSSLAKVIYGNPALGHQQSKRVKAETATKVLAVRADLTTLAGGATVDGTGTRRRLQALIAIGWSQSKLANRMGYTVRNFCTLLHGERDVTAKTARSVRALYDELWATEPPRTTTGDKGAYTRSRHYAATHGWAVPLAWDDESIDDPTATPDTGEPERTGLRVEDIDWFLDENPLATAQHVADRFHLTRDAVQMACRRADRQDLLGLLARNADLAHPGQVTNRRAAAA